MTRVTLDSARLAPREAAQEYLRSAFALPDYYGGNLDALHDVLTGLADIRVEVLDSGNLADRSGYAFRVLRVLLDSAGENPGLEVEVIK